MKYFTEITNNSESARKTLLLKTKFFLEYLHLLWHSLKQLVCIQVCLELPRPIKDKIHYGPNLLDKVFHIFMSSTDFCSYKSCNFFFLMGLILLAAATCRYLDWLPSYILTPEYALRTGLIASTSSVHAQDQLRLTRGLVLNLF